MNFIKAHDKAFSMFAVGLLVAGFIGDVKWTVMAQAVGVL